MSLTLFSPDSQTSAILLALKAILQLGNVQFEENATGTIIRVGDDDDTSTSSSRKLIDSASALLGFTAAQLSQSLTVRTMKVRNETVIMQMEISQAIDSRNTLCKEI